MLEHGNFHIGAEFWTEAGRWRCTEVGARTICAIKLEGDPRDWDGNSAYANAAGQGCACQRSRMGKSAHLRQKTLNKLSGSSPIRSKTETTQDANELYQEAQAHPKRI